LYGHEGLRNRLAGAVAARRLPQALLFEGPSGVGKQRLALWLGQALLCERGPGSGEGCGACRACKLVLNLSHPDVHWFVPVEPPKDTVFVLTAAEPGALLTTILSRVVRVRVAGNSDSVLAAFARTELGLKSEGEIMQRVAAADGCIGRLLAPKPGGPASSESA